MKRRKALPRSTKRIARRSRPRAKGKPRFKVSGQPDEAFRAWVRRQVCWFRYGVGTLMPCAGAVQPHHVKARGAGGPDRRNLLPLCAAHHGWVHTAGRRSVEAYIGINLATAAHGVWDWYQRAGVPPEGSP